MANTTITMRIDENVKSELQKLMSDLGLDVTTYFTMAAKQAIREQRIPFQAKINTTKYEKNAYQLAMNNTIYNSEGKAVVSKDDEWREETEWDDLFEQMKKKRGV